MRKTRKGLLSENRQLQENLAIMRMRFKRYMHDMHSPLSTVDSWLDIINEDSSPDIRECIQEAFMATEKLRKLLGRAFNPEIAVILEIEDVDCSQLVADLVYDIQVGNKKAQYVDITWDILLPTIRTDALQISRVLQNLIDNAIKFCSDESPTIHISVEQKEEYWLFAVTDNGIGINPDEAKIVFDEGVHNKEYEGDGLGLAICREIVEYHGGKISLESKIKKGSIFFFTIPILA
ncbi:HAMP domain-containing histidine kinase [Patescibacteria group bacterium]|nr:HAMP domain-containing histidine kinase [Patescibacteria group bacterium]